MDFTSASASKYLRRLQDDKEHLLSTEAETCTYVRAEGEADEPPAYDYRATRERIDAIDRAVLAVRHALHGFNQRTVLPESGLTIDEALIVLAQLSAKRDRVAELRARQPRERLREGYYGGAGAPVEYRYANYDVAEAQADYETLSDQIAALQLEIDLANQTQVFSVDLEASRGRA